MGKGILNTIYEFFLRNYFTNEHTSQAYVQWPLACVPSSADEFKSLAMRADHGLSQAESS